MSRRAAAAVLFGIPALALAGAFAWLAVAHGTPRLLPVVVHENGRYTLAQTILYFRHFLREIPIVFLYALVSATAIRCYGPVATMRGPRASRWPWLLAAALVVLAWIVTVRQWGAETAFRDLLQGYLTDDSYVYGSHWRAHVLSSIASLMAATVLAMALARAVDGSWPTQAGWIGWMRTFAPALVLIAAATVVFHPTMEPFVARRYVLHEAREAVTHGIISLPLSFGVLLAAGFGRPPAENLESAARPARMTWSRRTTVLLSVLMLGFAGVLSALIVPGIAPSARAGGISWAARAPAHAFEHSLDYVLLVLLSLGLGNVPQQVPSNRIAAVRESR